MIVLVAPPARSRRSGGARQALVAVAQLRLMVLALVFGAIVLAILIRLAVLAVWAEPATPRDPLAGLPPRGDITDRNGQPLARTIDGWSIAIHPNQVIGDKGKLAAQLAALVPDRNPGQYLQLLNSGSSFAWIRRRALPDLVKQVNALGEPGIEMMREPDRLYPQSTLAAHVLGYLSSDGSGGWGMERVLQKQLTADTRPSVPLSLDLRVQAAMENELARSMASFQAVGAAGVILDVHTGEILAMVSLPSFNPNAIAGPIPRNNMTQSRYELGSTFKPIAVAAAIESGKITSMSRKFDTQTALRIGRFQIRDSHPENRPLNIPETLIHSSNVATARIADEIGREPLEQTFLALGFKQKSGIEIENETTIWPHAWDKSTTLTTAFGHGIAVTPLHLATAYAALVNGGIYRPATLMKVEPGKAKAGKRVFSDATSARLRQLLRLIVTDGTGSKADAPGYRVGGKTGTAERPGAGGYSASKNVSTFAAAFPMDAPRYVVIAMLDSPIGNAESAGQRTAGWTAAPLVARLVMRTGPLLGVIPDANRDVDLTELKPLVGRPPQGDSE